MTIPDLSAFFKHAGFDDPDLREQARLQTLTGQRAPRTSDGGRALLWWCAVCEHPWYELGRARAFTHLSAEQLATVAEELQVQTLARLPLGLCPACSARMLGGIPRCEVLPQSICRLTWSGLNAGTALCVIVPGAEQDTVHQSLQHALTWPAEPPLVLHDKVARLLHWVSALPDPEWVDLTLFTHDTRTLLDAYAAAPDGQQWQGFFWHLWKKDEPITVLLASTARPGQSGPPAVIARLWSTLALLMVSLFAPS